ncbi:DUF2269 family protein [Gracilibacillus alcaliphilus]|uniref:DUF2269 family protein n=1 Tax=Gracilibacillus alcaliphilus TaxID=1401441 RepID=UPI001957729D|nr:DUF2269 family protein [Gracilibacillus alcaliphilus]MBM7676337.1 putative membrane protein [Gracilibacillus alcaliphilus]
MNSLYSILVIAHILSAIIGIGPGFILTTLVKTAQTMDQVRYVFAIKYRLHRFVRTGGILLLATGLLLGAVNPFLFQQGWFLLSLFLYLIVLILGVTLLKTYTRPIRQMIADLNIKEIPSSYYHARNKLLRTEYIVNLLIIVIILLMITKPF